ncbi:MAG: DUF3568 family protein [Candidatus Omnitrophota bacterium]|nr:DUF3568 family protein [Candidatus Omnitrophota bacterium]
MRKITYGVLLTGLAVVSSGCLAVAAAGGAVAWQGGKVISEEKVPMDRAVYAVESAFSALKIELKEKVSKTQSTQLRGEYPDGANVAVDVVPTGDQSCRIEIRVGIGLKDQARDLLNKIRSRF